jgi:hypothetical protein
MKQTTWILTLFFTLFLSPSLFADDHDVDFNEQTDFSKFKTFTINETQITARQPELNSPLVRNKITDTIRAQLVAKGLKEVQNRADIVVNYRLGATDRREVERFPAGRRGRLTRLETFRFTEGTLVIDLRDRDAREMVWRGIYRDDESNRSKLASKLPDDVKKLFSEYPPKKNKK